MSVAPIPADIDSSPWWEALSRRQLLVQRCQRCGRLRWPGRAICGECHSEDWRWVPACGHGTVASWTVTHRRSDTGDTTNVVALVRLDDQDDILIPGYLDGPADGAGLSIGTPVTVGFEDAVVDPARPPVTVLRWRRADT